MQLKLLQHTKGKVACTVAVFVWLFSAADAATAETTMAWSKLPRLEVSFGKVDGLPSPLGASSKPKFSWALFSTSRNVTQSSYRVVLSRTKTGAISKVDVVCDTGEVASSKSTLVQCGTSPLDAGQQYWWSVRVRAVDGSQSDWMAPHSFGVGLQSRQDWSPAAKFIGLNGTDMNSCPWFRTTFRLDNIDLNAIQNGTASALLHVASVGFHEPFVNGVRVENNSILMPSVSDMGRRILSRTYDLKHRLKIGDNALGLWLAPGWASLSWPSGADGAPTRPVVGFNISKAPLVMAELRFQRTAGTRLLRPSIVTNNGWTVHTSNIAHNDHSGSGWRWANYYGEDLDHTKDEPGWSYPSFDDANWTAAAEYPLERLVTPESLEPVGVVETVPAVEVVPCPQNTSHSSCSAKSNLLGGVQAECESFVGGCGPSNLLNLTCASGVIKTIEFASFGTPRGNCGSFAASPCNSSISYSVVADACLGKKSCSIMPNSSVFGGDPCRGQKKRLAVQASGCVPVPDPPHTVNQTSCYVITMKKLFTGWLQIDKLPAPPGANVTLQYSSTAGVQEEWTAHDSVVISGTRDGSSFSNRFNWHEFQYVTVKSSELTSPPDLSKIRGLRIRNARPRVGWFESSDAMLNKVYNAHVETIEGLQQSGMLVDCPNRERFGYGGDSNSHVEFVMYTYASAPLFEKWTRDWADVSGQAPQDTQPAAGLPDGNVPNSAPTFDGAGGPAWGAICVLMPYRHYLATGDISVLHSAYATMRGYLSFLIRHAVNGTGLLRPSGFDFLGDWQSPHGNGGGEDSLLFNNAHFVYVLRIATQVALTVGAASDASVFSSAATAIGAATHSQFYNATTAKYLEGKQTQQLTPLISGLVPNAVYEDVVKALIDEIEVAQNGHLDTGTFGTYFLQNFLSTPAVLSDTKTPGRAGPRRDDLLLKVATVTTFPGYGYHIEQGCTTWPETWDCRPVAGGTSRMHSTHNGFGLWFYQGLLGIRADPTSPGFGTFTLRPAFKSGLAWARGAIHTPHGAVNISWSATVSSVALNISVPVNSRAHVWLPAAKPGDVSDGANPAVQAATFIRQDGSETVWSVGSGQYTFLAARVPHPPMPGE